jgi:hypothetical protein
MQQNLSPRTCPLPAVCALLMSLNYGTENALDTSSASPPLIIGGYSNSATAEILDTLPQWVAYCLHVVRLDLWTFFFW